MRYIQLYPEIKKLIHGYQQFQKQHFSSRKGPYQHFAEHGQSPNILVISCCDSRVDPQTLTQSEPGELFIIRNVANLVPHYEDSDHCYSVSAGLEFAVLGLEVKHVLLLGHFDCGGIRALLQYSPDHAPQNFVEHWMKPALQARAETLAHCGDRPLKEQSDECERRTLLLSYRNLLSFPWIKDRVDQGLLNLHAWYFDLAEGSLYGYTKRRHRFIKLS